MKGLLLFPNTLYINSINNNLNIILYEHPKFFTKYKFHKLKLIFHRATMKSYDYTTKYIEYHMNLRPILKEYTEIYMYDPTDFDVMNDIKKLCNSLNIILHILDSKSFILTPKEIDNYIKSSIITTKKPYFNATFYKYVRRTKNILMTSDKTNPIGGKWSYDILNRIKFPKEYKEDPKVFKSYTNKIIEEATEYVNKHFPNNIGETNMYLPITHSDSKKWLKRFIKLRLKQFGPYEDAIDPDVIFGYHSCISALLNVGLLEPSYVIKEALKYKKRVPIQSLEGFIRQVLSWREYSRMLYIKEHKKFKTLNFLGHTKSLDKSWYNGTTGILPVDNCIKKALKYAYCHHIERLMILGNYMLISMIHPKYVYKWFIEVVSIDAYEWVMEPNVYGMSQHSVGQLMMNRVYFSSSNYIFKMSNYKKSQNVWSKKWDNLYHKFIKRHRKYLRTIYANAVQAYNSK